MIKPNEINQFILKDIYNVSPAAKCINFRKLTQHSKIYTLLKILCKIEAYKPIGLRNLSDGKVPIK